jgi:hypothetical protein
LSQRLVCWERLGFIRSYLFFKEVVVIGERGLLRLEHVKFLELFLEQYLAIDLRVFLEHSYCFLYVPKVSLRRLILRL